MLQTIAPVTHDLGDFKVMAARARERQRIIYTALGELMKEGVHALSIKATAPGE